MCQLKIQYARAWFKNIIYYICTYVCNVYCYLICATVISEPKDVTVCKGEQETTFTCVLDSNISSNNVQWYRLIKDTGTTVMVDPDDDHLIIFTRTGNALTSSLIVTNARQCAGYYWIRLPSVNVCNVSLTVLDAESMYSMLIEFIVIVCISLYTF